MTLKQRIEWHKDAIRNGGSNLFACILFDLHMMYWKVTNKINRRWGH